jgi:hypothetical protein
MDSFPNLKKTKITEVKLPKGGIHEGKVVAIGHFTPGGIGHTVTIAWEGDDWGPTLGFVNQEKWEMFLEAFRGSGKIRIYTDFDDPIQWMQDFSMLMALK